MLSQQNDDRYSDNQSNNSWKSKSFSSDSNKFSNNSFKPRRSNSLFIRKTQLLIRIFLYRQPIIAWAKIKEIFISNINLKSNPILEILLQGKLLESLTIISEAQQNSSEYDSVFEELIINLFFFLLDQKEKALTFQTGFVKRNSWSAIYSKAKNFFLTVKSTLEKQKEICALGDKLSNLKGLFYIWITIMSSALSLNISSLKARLQEDPKFIQSLTDKDQFLLIKFWLSFIQTKWFVYKTNSSQESAEEFLTLFSSANEESLNEKIYDDLIKNSLTDPDAEKSLSNSYYSQFIDSLLLSLEREEKESEKEESEEKQAEDSKLLQTLKELLKGGESFQESDLSELKKLLPFSSHQSERRPYERKSFDNRGDSRGDSRGFERKSFQSRSFERKPYERRSFENRGERRPFENRSENRSFNGRKNFSSSRSDDRPSFRSRDFDSSKDSQWDKSRPFNKTHRRSESVGNDIANSEKNSSQEEELYLEL